MNLNKIKNELKAIVIIVVIALSAKVTILEAYIVPTGSMENEIMTGDFLIGSRFVYGMRTPDWIGVPWTDIGFSLPYITFPKFKIPKRNDIIIFKYPKDSRVKYVKRCVAGPGDTISVYDKIMYINSNEEEMPKNGKFLYPIMSKKIKQSELFLSSEDNINKDNFGPLVIPKKGNIILINDSTNWKFLLPLIIMEGNEAMISHRNTKVYFTLEDANEIFRRKGEPNIYDKYHPKGDLITPWSRALKQSDFKYLVINGIPISEYESYKLKQNYYFAMGDNRDDSLDSRYWGFVPENYILGEAILTYFSLDLDTWWPRFNRIGTVLD